MGLLLVLVQHKGWTYHYIPFYAAGFLSLATAIAAGGRRWLSDKWLWGGGSLVLGALAVMWFTGRENARPESPSDLALRKIVERCTRPGDRVLMVATSVTPAYPMLLQIDRRPGSRYLCCMPIAMLYAGAKPTEGQPIYRSREEAPADERRFLAELREDVERLRPQLIVVNACRGWQGLPPSFNTFEYLVYSGWCQSTLAPYHEIHGLKEWRVFARNTP